MSLYTRRAFTLGLGTASLLSRLPAATLKQVRLGVTTDEIDDDLLTAVKFLREFGVEYAEIRNLWGKYNTALPVEQIREARSLMDQNGVKTSIVGTAFFRGKLPMDDPEGHAALEKEWKLFDDAVERARILGTDKLRIFAFTTQGSADRSEKVYGRIHELLREAGRRAKAANVRLAIENLGGSYVNTGADAAQLLKAVKDERVGLTWDPNNAGEAGEKAYPDGYRLLDPARILHVHLRDYRHRPDGKVEWCAVGEGEFDNLNQIRSLLKSGYKENFTLETHWRAPQGKAYATRTSLTALLKIIDQV